MIFFESYGPVTEELTQTICKFECSCYNILGKHHLTAKCEGILFFQPVLVDVLGSQVCLPASQNTMVAVCTFFKRRSK